MGNIASVLGSSDKIVELMQGESTIKITGGEKP